MGQEKRVNMGFRKTFDILWIKENTFLCGFVTHYRSAGTNPAMLHVTAMKVDKPCQVFAITFFIPVVHKRIK